jgi:Rps23 Pro-64 3,4-dihydroxylase Tpa1-like proline 4-hydroxylase
MAELIRATLGRQIAMRLREQSGQLSAQWEASAPINYCVLDDVLPEDWAHRIGRAFPSDSQMVLKSSLRELKFVAAQMDRYEPLLEEAIYAFQTPETVGLIEQITGLAALEPDEMLYAGGISTMAHGHFLNPHIDNSHDKFRQRYRVLNLLFYVSPDWGPEDGCNLELWPEGPGRKRVQIVSRFNRLVVMVTHPGSWHSVSPNASQRNRCCVSNYYFSELPVGGADYFHVTSFRGRPEQPVRDLILRADIWLRTAIRRVFPHGIRENRHFYNKAKADDSRQSR